MPTSNFAVASQPGTRINANRLFGGLGSAQGFNLTGILLYAIPAFLSTLVFDQTRFGGPFELWLYLAFAGYVTAFVLYVLGGVVYRRLILRYGEHPGWVQGYYAFIGLVRASVIYLLGTEWHLVPPTDWLFRFLGGPIFTGVTLGIAVIISINFARSASEGRKLDSERLRLSALQDSMQQRIATQRAELIGRVRGVLAPALEAVRSQLNDAGKSREVVATLSSTVEELVRPLSHSLAREDAALGVDDEVRSRKVWSINVWRTTEIHRLIIPQLSAILITIPALPAAVAMKPGVGGFTMAVVEGLICWLVLSLLRVLVGKARLPILASGLLVALTVTGAQFLVLRIVTDLGLALAPHDQSNIVLYGLIMGSALAIGQAVQTARGIAVAELSEVTASMALLVSRLRQEVWLNNRRMAAVLHGPVQAALYASGMKLAQSKEVPNELLAQVESDIAMAMDRIDLDVDVRSEDFAEVINQIVSLWRGSCEISVFTTEECSAALHRDRNAAACVVEVVQEAISNAIKHGKASNASVMISKIAPNIAEVRVRNDGAPISGTANSGYGSQILDEVCHRWSIDDRSKGVLLIAEIALSA